jgi:hypothetical protein
MIRAKSLLPTFFLILCAAGAAYGALHISLHENLGPQCELKEGFAAAGRPAYSHHCVCWGLKYNENPQPTPNADAKRCFGIVRKSWVDTDDIAVHELEEQTRQAKNGRMFDKLAPEVQAKIERAYKRLREGAFRHDYPYMLEQTKIILLEVDDYGETKALEALAREKIAQSTEPVIDTRTEVRISTSTAETPPAPPPEPEPLPALPATPETHTAP